MICHRWKFFSIFWSFLNEIKSCPCHLSLLLLFLLIICRQDIPYDFIDFSLAEKPTSLCLIFIFIPQYLYSYSSGQKLFNDQNEAPSEHADSPFFLPCNEIIKVICEITETVEAKNNNCILNK